MSDRSRRSQSRRRRRPLTTPSCWTEARLQTVIPIGQIAVMKRACIMRAIRALICFAPGNLGRRREATLIHPVTHRFRNVSAVFFASRVDNSRLTTQVRPTLDHRPDRSPSLA
jgi:hypothetical protein